VLSSVFSVSRSRYTHVTVGLVGVDVYQEALDVGDVVLYGLSLIQPLITPEALGYPALAREYFAFLSWLIETYPHKISVMQKPMLEPIMACLLHGIAQVGERSSCRCIRALVCEREGGGMGGGVSPMRVSRRG